MRAGHLPHQSNDQHQMISINGSASTDSHFGSTKIRLPSKSTILVNSQWLRQRGTLRVLRLHEDPPLILSAHLNPSNRLLVEPLVASDSSTPTRSSVRYQEDRNEYVHLLARARRFMACRLPQTFEQTPKPAPKPAPKQPLISL
jgi:hypothetical protein